MSDSAVLRRSEWTTGRRHKPIVVRRQRANHLELAAWMDGRIEMDESRPASDDMHEIRLAIAAYKLAAERVQHAVVVESEARPARSVHAGASLIGILRLYVGVALLGAILGGLAFSWLGHREVAQLVGAICGVLGYFVVHAGSVHGKRTP